MVIILANLEAISIHIEPKVVNRDKGLPLESVAFTLKDPSSHKASRLLNNPAPSSA